MLILQLGSTAFQVGCTLRKMDSQVRIFGKLIILRIESGSRQWNKRVTAVL
jgi:hypothetical protein